MDITSQPILMAIKLVTCSRAGSLGSGLVRVLYAFDCVLCYDRCLVGNRKNIFQLHNQQGTGYSKLRAVPGLDTLSVVGSASKDILVASENKAYSSLLHDFMQVRADLGAKKYVILIFECIYSY